MASRALVYPSGTKEARHQPSLARRRERPRERESEERRENRAEDRTEEKDADGYREKLVKYVPAEVIAFFVPITAALGEDDEALVIAVLIAGAAGTIGFLHQASTEIPEDQRAPRITYGLALIAYLAWAIGTSAATSGALGISLEAAGVTLGIAAFLVPAFDFWKIGGRSKSAG